MLDGVRLPRDWAAPIIHSWGKTGNLERALRDAVAAAEADDRPDDARLYKAMLGQFHDFFGTKPQAR